MMLRQPLLMALAGRTCVVRVWTGIYVKRSRTACTTAFNSMCLFAMAAIAMTVI